MKLLPKIAILSTLCLTSSPALAEPPTYPLLCRGGASMRIMTNHDVNSAGVPGATAMFIYFTPSSQPGSVKNPQPGECVWLDRTFRPGEPTVMWIKSPNIEFAFQVTGDGRIVVDTTGPRLNVEGANISKEAKNWQYLVDGVLRGQLFTAHVYNEGGRVMVVKRVGN